MIDSPVYPDELRALPACSSRPGFPVSRAARHPRRLGPPARAAGVPRGAARRAPSRPRAAGRRAGAAQRELREFDDEHYVDGRGAAGASARCSRCRCPGHWDRLGRRARARAAPDRRAHRRRRRRSGSRGRACWSAATTSRRSRSRCSRRAARSTPTWRRSSGCGRWSSRPRVVPGHGAPIAGAAGADGPRRGRAYLEALASDAGRRRTLPAGRADAARSSTLHAENLAFVRGLTRGLRSPWLRTPRSAQHAVSVEPDLRYRCDRRRVSSLDVEHGSSPTRAAAGRGGAAVRCGRASGDRRWPAIDEAALTRRWPSRLRARLADPLDEGNHRPRRRSDSPCVEVTSRPPQATRHAAAVADVAGSPRRYRRRRRGRDLPRTSPSSSARVERVRARRTPTGRRLALGGRHRASTCRRDRAVATGDAQIAALSA